MVQRPQQQLPMRINKFIALHSKYSRRKADELIEQGAVTINSGPPIKVGIDIDPLIDIIKINGKPLIINKKKTYIALNKPAGYITTRKDERDRKTVMDLCPNIESLKPVGRLDKDTEGLLLLSNDGHFINRLTHPKFECQKEYYAVVEGNLSKKYRQMLEEGIVIEGKKTAPAKIRVMNAGKLETTLTITIKEGRKRQIRKMFDLVVHSVKYLRRVRIGSIQLGDLKVGETRNLTKEEIDVN